jgi:hypothetical protein
VGELPVEIKYHFDRARVEKEKWTDRNGVFVNELHSEHPDYKKMQVKGWRVERGRRRGIRGSRERERERERGREGEREGGRERGREERECSLDPAAAWRILGW